MKKSLLFLLLFAIILSACGPAAPGPCDKDLVQAASKQLLDIVKKWQDAYNIASSTGRIGLAQPVQEMQSIKRETEALEVPKCLTTARDYLASHMNSSVNGFLAFMSQESDAVVQDNFTEANDLLSKYTAEMERIADCVPDCN
jgi:hypothetical protein